MVQFSLKFLHLPNELIRLGFVLDIAILRKLKLIDGLIYLAKNNCPEAVQKGYAGGGDWMEEMIVF